MIKTQSMFRTQYNYDRELVSRNNGLTCPEPTRTQQQFKEECDINVILKRFGVTGHLPLMAVQPVQGDFTGVEDYQSMLNTLMAADDNFMRLPSDVREKFGQDPRKFVDFCVDPANIDAVREMGLAPRPAGKPAPTLVEIVNGNKPEGNQPPAG